ncbi:hypothetical protein ACFT9I_10105 [Streptomyces sp. NPDC057137]|uniref:hypothetical protein n=1 Tax=Streptomyces sp. NPDC057137 TaxID=3346030 RepID=UPI003627E1DC
MRTGHTTALTVALLLTLAGCSDGGSSSPRGASAPTARAYDVHDCKALLERDYEADALRDASEESECRGLTRDEYVEAVGEVLGGHKGDVLEQAANELVWDEAWDGTDAAQRKLVCERLVADGAITVGQEMMDAADSAPDGTEVDMAQYFLDEKC